MTIKDTSTDDKIYGQTPWGTFLLRRRHRTYIWPCTIITTRYSGAYASAYYVAFPVRFPDVPADAIGSDTACMEFWWDEVDDEDVGRGDTPEEALQDLIDKIISAYESE